MQVRRNLQQLCFAVAFGAAALASGEAAASTINQNTSWTINRGAPATYRVVAYGDSIFAGYAGDPWGVAKRASPLVSGEYLAKQWGANVQVVRRTKSGARADDIYENKILAERSYMEATNTRVVMFEMCGNDYLQARSAFTDQTGTCDYSGLNNALVACTTYTERAMQAIVTYAKTANAKVVHNLFYPGYNADNVLTGCTDPTTGTRINKRDKFLPLLARSNWRTCHLAWRYGFQCADAFAESMAADYDSNGDGLIDSEAIRYREGETEDQYVQRITVTYKSTLRDSNGKLVAPSTSYDYLQSDDTHQTYTGGSLSWSIFSTGTSGSGAPDYSDAQIVDGKNPYWNQRGHERVGHAMSRFNPATP